MLSPRQSLISYLWRASACESQRQRRFQGALRRVADGDLDALADLDQVYQAAEIQGHLALWLASETVGQTPRPKGWRQKWRSIWRILTS